MKSVSKKTFGLVFGMTLGVATAVSSTVAIAATTTTAQSQYEEACNKVMDARKQAAEAWAQELEKNRTETLGKGVDEELDSLDSCLGKTMDSIRDIYNQISNIMSFFSGGFSFDPTSLLSSAACSFASTVDSNLDSTITQKWNSTTQMFSVAAPLPGGLGSVDVSLFDGVSTSGLISGGESAIGDYYGSQVGDQVPVQAQ